MKKLKILFSYLKNYKGVYSLAVLFTILSQVVVAMQPQLAKITIDSVIFQKALKTDRLSRLMSFFLKSKDLKTGLIIMTIAFIIFAVLRSLLTFARITLATQATESAVKELRDKLYNHIQLLPFSTHAQLKTGDLIQRCTTDIENIRLALYSQIMDIISSVFLMIYVLYLMFQTNTELVFYIFGTILLIFITSIVFFKMVEKQFEQTEKSEAKMTTVIQENLTGIRVIKAFLLHKNEIKKFKKASDDFAGKDFKLVKSYALFWGVLDALVLLQISGVIILGSVLAYHSRLTVGELVAFISYTGMFSYPITNLARTITNIGKSFVASRRIEEILKKPAEQIFPTKNKPNIYGKIEFNSVSFAYPDTPDNLILDKLSFTIEEGQTVAILGHTGSGKSSLAYLLSRLYEYNSGSIKLNGHELNTIDKGWVRSNIGLILQEPFLYGKTILENIKLAAPYHSEDTVRHFSKIAALDDDIMKFEEGYNTMVGERGVSLSGGQKQRLVIARTLIKNTPIIIFDDSLSAVDAETDIKIQKALNKQRQKKKSQTVIIISHRISTISNADKILVLKNGKLVEEGTHAELLKKDGWYKKVYQIQSGLTNQE
ncbi:MAG: ABC transporter permease [Treponema sp.]|nr:MAG: ABC transporter permease [Treponema sp.]